MREHSKNLDGRDGLLSGKRGHARDGDKKGTMAPTNYRQAGLIKQAASDLCINSG
jgi:hypothetical protein